MEHFGEKMTTVGRLSAEKTPHNWSFVMSEEGGSLAPATDTIYAGVEALQENDWLHAFEQTKKESRDFKLSSNVGSPSWDSVSEYFPKIEPFKEQFNSSWLSGNSANLTVAAPPQLNRMMLGSANLLHTALLQHFPDEWRQKDRGRALDNSVDMGSVQNVTMDNIQTMLDVQAVLARFADTPKELVALTERLLQVCPNNAVEIDGRQLKINPQNYTYLELFALAPFSFWAVARMYQPQSYRGAPVVHPENAERPIDPLFLYAVTREIPSTVERSRQSRHGGCPALYPAFHKYDLINRLGKLYIRSQKEFLERDHT